MAAHRRRRNWAYHQRVEHCQCVVAHNRRPAQRAGVSQSVNPAGAAVISSDALIGTWSFLKGHDLSGLDLSAVNITSICHDTRAQILHIHTDSGVEGMCPRVDAPTARQIAALFAPLLIGQNPFERERLWQAMFHATAAKHITYVSLANVDIALWDLAGKALDLPVFRVIGGFRERFPAMLIGAITDSIESVIAEASAAAASGFNAYCDRFAGTVPETALMAQRLRAAVGPDMHLVHDGRHRYSASDAATVGRALQAHDYLYIKAPLATADLAALKALAATLDVPILDNAFGPAPVRAASQLVAAQAIDLVNISLPHCGGITGALKLARMAEAFGLMCEFETNDGCGGFARAQLMAATRNAYFHAVDNINGQSPRPDATHPLRVTAGYVTASTRPGLGMEARGG